MSNPELSRRDRALAAAIALMRSKQALEEETALRSAQLRFLLLRFGLAASDVEIVAKASEAGAVPHALREAVRVRLQQENRRLSRLGRAGRGGYDFERHVAVRRALDWLAGKPSRIGDPAARAVRMPRRPEPWRPRPRRARPDPAKTAS